MPGVNNIRQSSDNSSVTIPYERTFRPIGRKNQPSDEQRLSEFRFCGCGWPQHLLLPRGRPDGLVFNLFAMISNFEGDAVPQDLSNVYVFQLIPSFLLLFLLISLFIIVFVLIRIRIVG